MTATLPPTGASRPRTGEHEFGSAPVPLRIHLLGGFRVTVSDRLVPPASWRLRKAQSLVKLLALAPGFRLPRDEVVDLLWPDLDPDAAANNLRVAVFAARRALAPAPLLLHGGMLALSPTAPLWTDVAAFEAAVAAARQATDPAAAWMAIDLYAGDLLPEDVYEDWATGRREALRRMYLGLLLELAGWEEVLGDLAGAIAALERLVAHEPTHEEAHRGLMRQYAQTGQRQQAVRQYEHLTEVLRQELDVAPEAASQELYQAVVAGTIEAAPPRPHLAVPPATPPRPTGNLPVPVTSFVGRQREIEEVERLLGTTRLLTLTGVGGAGKTRLALEVATRIQERYPDGAWLVELAPLADPDLVSQAVAQALGVSEQPGRALVETLAIWLRDRQLLLVLDNCEHLLEACTGLAATLLRTCPHLAILATSREVLGMVGETAWPVPPLSLPDSQVRGPLPGDGLEPARQSEAVQLFVTRAAAALPTVALTPANATAVVQVCRRLDGLPLAIELAAARLKVLTVEQLAVRLDDRFRLLTSGNRGALPRHQTLRAVIDWSYDLLSRAERVLLRRLAVFAGSWDLEAAEVVCAGGVIEQQEVLDLLARLVDKSLVQVEAGTGGEARYGLLETVRQYGWERLQEAGEAEGVQGGHRDYYLALAEQADLGLRGPEQLAWLMRLDREHPNLRAALEWSLAASDGAAAGLRLAGALRLFWLWRDHYAEGRFWLERMLTRRGEAEPAAAIRALDGAMFLAHRTGDNERALLWGREVVARCRAAGDGPAEVSALIWMGMAAKDCGDFVTAQALVEEGLALARTTGDPWMLGVALHFRGSHAFAVGEYAAAQAWMEEGLALFRRLGDRVMIALILSWLGEVAARQGEIGRARAVLEESLALKHALNMRWGVAISFDRLGLLAQLAGKAAEAAAWYAQALRLQQDSGDRTNMLRAVAGLAGAAAAGRAGARAARLLGAVAALRTALGLVVPISEREQHERDVATARSLLGDEAFAAAWAAGQALTLEEAVAAALDDAPASPTPAHLMAGAPLGVAGVMTTPADSQPGATRPALPDAVSAREWEVAERIAAGLTNRQIAAALSISVRTVDRHVENILDKLGLTTRAQIAAWVVAQRGPVAPAAEG